MKHHNNPRRWLSSAVAYFMAIGLAVVLPVVLPAEASAEPFVTRAIAPRFDARRSVAMLNLMDLRFLPAMQAAGSAVGQPYRAGGAAPGGFDCSGLVQWSFAQAGVGLPRDSRSQRAATFPVGEEQLRPGDLVFFGSPVFHVGIAIGAGRMIDAPRPGRSVQVVDIHRPGMAPSGFGRIK